MRRARRSQPLVVHVTTTDMSLELLLGPQLRAFRASGFDVLAMSAPGPYVAHLEAAGIAHLPLRHATRAMAPGHDAAALAELYRHFRRLRPDVVHTHNPKPGVYGRLAARLAGVPAIVNTVHGLYAQASDSRRRRAVVYGLERLAATCSDAELVQNPEDLATLRRLGLDGDHLTLLGNGVDLTRFVPPTPAARRAQRDALGVSEDTVVVGAVGRLVWEKGYRELFAAAHQLRDRTDVQFVVVGPRDESKSDAVDDAAIAAAEADGVRFLGSRHDVHDLYHAFDMYVLASYREGFPRSAMEAAASGLPVVATDIRGCRQVVDPGVTGVLVPARDAAALTTAVAALATSPEERARLARAATWKAAREFDQERVIDITLATYRRVLDAAARRSRHVSQPTPVPTRPVSTRTTRVRPTVVGAEEPSPA